MNYQELNAKTIDKWVAEGWAWGKPISHEEYAAAKDGKWNVLLTPTKNMPHDWLGELKGKKLLGLASGGGQQIPIFSALGANCTVLDYSESQIQSEIMVAAREKYEVRAICADMTKPLPFNPLKNAEQMKQLQEQDCGVQFSHTAEEQIGGQLKAGFILTDLYEDTNGEGRLHEMNIPSFWATRAIKP